MPLEATARHGLDVARSWVIGDHWRDVQMGHAVGARAVLLRTGHGRDQERWRPEGQRVEAICDNLMAATAFILAEGR
jgi:D-glycero-D-manno-heptose 1,7-bisphosphate phosphatase